MTNNTHTMTLALYRALWRAYTEGTTYEQRCSHRQDIKRAIPRIADDLLDELMPYAYVDRVRYEVSVVLDSPTVVIFSYNCKPPLEHVSFDTLTGHTKLYYVYHPYKGRLDVHEGMTTKDPHRIIRAVVDVLAAYWESDVNPYRNIPRGMYPALSRTLTATGQAVTPDALMDVYNAFVERLPGYPPDVIQMTAIDERPDVPTSRRIKMFYESTHGQKRVQWFAYYGFPHRAMLIWTTEEERDAS